MCREGCTSSTLSRYMSCNCAPSGANGTPTFRARAGWRRATRRQQPMESMERLGRCPWQPIRLGQLEEGQPYMPNIVYVLTNPAMPGMVKIGMTDQEVQLRMRQLYTTGVPLPFECVIARRMEGREAAEIETALHTAFDPSGSIPLANSSRLSLSKRLFFFG